MTVRKLVSSVWGSKCYLLGVKIIIGFDVGFVSFLQNMDNPKKVKDDITRYLKDAVRAVQVQNVETVEPIGR